MTTARYKARSRPIRGISFLANRRKRPRRLHCRPAHNEMFKTATSLGVETITLPEFLSQMGYKPQDRTVQLGTGASARDFPARPERDGSGLGTVSIPSPSDDHARGSGGNRSGSSERWSVAI